MAWRQCVDSSFNLCCHASSHEEADIKVIFHAIKTKEKGATQLDVYSPDTCLHSAHQTITTASQGNFICHRLWDTTEKNTD